MSKSFDFGLKTTKEESLDIKDTMVSFFSNQTESDDEGCVGIFWYLPQRNRLFGVNKKQPSKISHISHDRKTTYTPHEDYWAKQQRKMDAAGKPLGFLEKEYTDIPRGRIFYNIKTEKFEIYHSKWLGEFPQAEELILEEFELIDQPFEFIYDEHWDIGHGWSERAWDNK